MRVTSNTVYQGLMNQVTRNLNDYYKYNEMIGSEKQINRISDDPAGLATALKHRGNAAAYEQYFLNIRDASEYLRATDLALNKIDTLLARVREITETVATETASEIEKQVARDQIQELINEAIGIANSKMRDRYIFAGTQGENQAYSLEGRILTPLASTNNQYNDLVTAGGDYKGNGEFIVRFVQGGDVGTAGNPTTAMYQISSDGGETWSDAEYFTNLALQITDSEGNPTGLHMTFQPGTIGDGDEFRLQVVPGKYLGDTSKVEFNNNMYSRVSTNVTGYDIFEATGFFDKMYQLKNALDNGNGLEIQDALGHFDALQTSIQTQITETGIYLNRLEITKNNLTSLQENVFDSIQNIEKVDPVEVLTRFAMSENALNASISALAKVFPVSLMQYI